MYTLTVKPCIHKKFQTKVAFVLNNLTSFENKWLARAQILKYPKQSEGFLLKIGSLSTILRMGFVNVIINIVNSTNSYIGRMLQRPT